MSERHPPQETHRARAAAAAPTGPSQPPEHPPILGDAPDNDASPISPLVPASMHRAEADARAIATSPDFSERPDGATATPPVGPEDGTP